MSIAFPQGSISLKYRTSRMQPKPELKQVSAHRHRKDHRSSEGFGKGNPDHEASFTGCFRINGLKGEVPQTDIQKFAKAKAAIEQHLNECPPKDRIGDQDQSRHFMLGQCGDFLFLLHRVDPFNDRWEDLIIPEKPLVEFTNGDLDFEDVSRAIWCGFSW